MTDDINDALRKLRNSLPAPRSNLSEIEKDQLVSAVGGPLTAQSIRQAMDQYPHERIPWLFSSIDPQLILDIMANDLEAAIQRAKDAKKLPSAQNN